MNVYKKGLPFLIFTLLSSVAFERALFVLYLTEVGYSAWHISTLQILLFVANILAEVPTGILADRWGRKRALQLGVITMAASVYGQYWAGDHFAVMVLAFVLHGVSFAFISGSAAALLYDNLKAANASGFYLRLTSASRLLSSVGLGVSMALGGFLKLHSWHWVYGASAVVLLLALVALLFLPEAVVHHNSGAEPPRSMKNLWPELRRLLPVTLPFSLMHAAMTPYFVYSQKVFAALNMGAVSISSTVAVSEVLGAGLTLLLVGSRWRWDFRRLAPPLLVVFALALTANVLSSTTVAIVAFLLSAALVLFLEALALDYIQGQIVDSRSRASLLSMVTFFDATAIALSYLLYGFLFENFSPSHAVALTAVLPMTAVIAMKLRKVQAPI